MSSYSLSKKARRTVGNRIKLAREKAGLTRAQLAKKCKIGPSQISNYENGFCTPSFAVALRLVDALGAEVFLKGEEGKDAA